MNLTYTKLTNQLVLLSLALAIMILSIVALTRANSADLSYHIITANYRDSLVLKVKAEKNTFLPMMKFYFPGTSPGCYCKNSPNDKIQTDYCSENQLVDNCTNIEPLSLKNLNIWKGSNEISLERDTGNYAKYLENAAKSGDECKEGFKNCGILDSLKNKLCFPISQDCPLNSIEITEKKKIFSSSSTEVDLGNGYFLYYSNHNTSSMLVASLKFSEGSEDKICADPTKYFTPLASLRYKLWKGYLKQETDNCPALNNNKNLVYEEFFNKIDSIDAKSFFENNNLYLPLLQLKDFNAKQIDTQINLYYKGYYGFDLNCPKSFSMFQEEINLFQETFSKDPIIACIIFSILSSVIAATLVFTVQLHGRRKRMIVVSITSFILIGLAILFSAFSYRFDIYPLDDLFLNCVDNYMKEIILQNKSVNTVAHTMLLTAFILSLISIIFISLAIFLAMKETDRESVDTEIELNKPIVNNSNNTTVEVRDGGRQNVSVTNNINPGGISEQSNVIGLSTRHQEIQDGFNQNQGHVFRKYD